MSHEHAKYFENLDRRVQNAVDELKNIILGKYSNAAFSISQGHDDPEKVHLVTTVDLDDPDEIGDLVSDRLVELQVEERIPVYVIPMRTPERILADLQGDAARS